MQGQKDVLQGRHKETMEVWNDNKANRQYTQVDAAEGMLGIDSAAYSRTIGDLGMGMGNE